MSPLNSLDTLLVLAVVSLVMLVQLLAHNAEAKAQAWARHHLDEIVHIQLQFLDAFAGLGNFRCCLGFTHDPNAFHGPLVAQVRVDDVPAIFGLNDPCLLEGRTPAQYRTHLPPVERTVGRASLAASPSLILTNLVSCISATIKRERAEEPRNVQQ